MDAALRRVISPEINADATVTFRVFAPNASSVAIEGRFLQVPVQLLQDDSGIWSTTLGPIAPGIYEYSFDIDGMITVDPSNVHVKPMHRPRTSILTIVGEGSWLHQFRRVPHGTLHRHSYHSEALKALRHIEVYTPPNYEGTRDIYPVLYLLSGSGETESIWSVHGRVHWILDNLIAEKQAVPMIMVMIDGEAKGRKLPRTRGNYNTEALRQDLFQDVIPLVEHNYRVRTDSNNRGIAGVSRGGGQATIIGLINRDSFSWIGAMSSAFIEHKHIVQQALSEPSKVNNRMQLIWLRCGKGERVQMSMNRLFHADLQARGIVHDFLAGC